MRRLLTTSLLLALASSASAVPLNFNHQGRLFDTQGLPLDAPTDVVFRIYAEQSGGTAVWEESWVGLEFDGGYYNAMLGANTALDTAVFDGTTLYMSLQVGTSSEMSDRIVLVSVPYAMRAANADQADSLAPGLVIDVDELRINGTTIIDNTGAIDANALSGAPDTLADLGCSVGQIAAYDGTGWGCVANTHAAADITSGTLEIARLPTGTGSDQLAVGDHAHDGADIISGTISATYLPVGTTSTDVAAGNHTHSAADVGALPVGTTAADIGALPAGTTAADIGAVALGDAILVGGLNATCDASTTSLHGTIRYGNDAFYGCTPAGWRTLDNGLQLTGIGGTVTEAGGYRIHTFTADGTFQFTGDAGDVEVLVLAGGGGGGGRSGGGGGAGGLVLDNAYAMTSGQSVNVVIGDGGAGGVATGQRGANGVDTSFDGITAVGGGGGGSDSTNIGFGGGSGGGGRYGADGGLATSGQGHDGGGSFNNPYAGGGGGGAGSPGIAGTSGGDIGDGGTGLVIDISGSDVCYGGGGGGGAHNPANGRGLPTNAPGLNCGGGIGGAPGGNNSGAPGVDGSGGGGGAGSTNSGPGGSGGTGGSGIVIVRYAL